MSTPGDTKRRRLAAYRKGFEDGLAASPATEVLKAADAVVSAYDARGDMPGTITTLEAVLRKHGYAMPAGKVVAA
jgi:hypothetical protein